MRIATFHNVPVLFGATWVPYTGSVRDAIETALRVNTVPDAAAEPGDQAIAFKSAYVRIPAVKASASFWKRDVHAAKQDAEASHSTAGVIVATAATPLTKNEQQAIPKATLAAAALAAHGADGVYVLDLDPAAWWVCGVRGGRVIPGTDVYATPDAIVPSVRALAELNLPVFANEAIAADPRLRGCRSTDILRLLAKSERTLRARPYHPARVPALVAAGAVALIAVAVIGVHVHDQRQAALAAQRSQQNQIKAYVQSVRQAVGAYPRSAAWALSALDAMRTNLPPVLGGFALDTVTCTPSACVATYKVATPYGYVTAPFHAAFPHAAIAQVHDSSTLTVTLPLHVATVPLTLAWLRARKPSGARLIDWIGTLPAMAPGARVNGQPLRRSLPAPAVSGTPLPPLGLEQTKIQSSLHLAPGALASFIQRASYGGFMPTRLTWSPMGFGWTLLWERIRVR